MHSVHQKALFISDRLVGLLLPRSGKHAIETTGKGFVVKKKFLGIGRFLTAYALVHFFSPDRSMKISNISKTEFFTKFITVILRPNVLLRAQ